MNGSPTDAVWVINWPPNGWLQPGVVVSAASVLAFVVLTVLIVRYTKRGVDSQEALVKLQEQQTRSQRLQALLSEKQMVKEEWDDLISAFMALNRAYGKIASVHRLPAERLALLKASPSFWEIGSLRLAADLAEKHIGQGIFTHVDLFVSLYSVVQEQVLEHGDGAAYGANVETTQAIDELQAQWQIIDPAFAQALQARGRRLNELRGGISELLAVGL